MNAMSVLGRLWKQLAVWKRPRIAAARLGNDDLRIIDRLSDMHRLAEEGDIEGVDFAWDELAGCLLKKYEVAPEILAPSEAERCEAAGDWLGAEAAHRKALAAALASGSLPEQLSAYGNMRAFQTLMGCGEEAMELAQAAVEVSRRAELDVARSMNLRSLAHTALQFGYISEAKSAIDEAVTLLRDEKLFEGMRGRCLAVRAACAQHAGDEIAAERDLAAAWQCLEPWTRTQSAVGMFVSLGDWWAVQAQLEAGRENRDEAADAWKQSVEWRRRANDEWDGGDVYTMIALARSLYQYSRALESASRPYEAGETLAESRAIREQIGLPQLADD
jgi:tetratricopeptide (TPR) repeat protein